MVLTSSRAEAMGTRQDVLVWTQESLGRRDSLVTIRTVPLIKSKVPSLGPAEVMSPCKHECPGPAFSGHGAVPAAGRGTSWP